VCVCVSMCFWVMARGNGANGPNEVEHMSGLKMAVLSPASQRAVARLPYMLRLGDVIFDRE
jgi:hypothetical protein